MNVFVMPVKLISTAENGVGCLTVIVTWPVILSKVEKAGCGVSRDIVISGLDSPASCRLVKSMSEGVVDECDGCDAD